MIDHFGIFGRQSNLTHFVTYSVKLHPFNFVLDSSTRTLIG